MKLTKAILKLERQASKAEKLAKTEQAKADALRAKLEQIQNLVGILGRKSIAKPTAKASKGRRGPRKGTMSVAGRARISAAQKKRWAAWKAKKKGTVAPRAKRHLSPEGRARIVAATKARWAKVRAAKEAKA